MRAISTACAWLASVSVGSTSSMLAGTRRSGRVRSCVLRCGRRCRSAVPRRPLSLASTLKPVSIARAVFAFCNSPLSLRLAMMRRRKVVVQREVAFEHRVDLVQEGGVGVQARDLVFVLVRHQLEQVTRHAFGQQLFAQLALRPARTVCARTGLRTAVRRPRPGRRSGIRRFAGRCHPASRAS
jgi:hypothetical protein